MKRLFALLALLPAAAHAQTGFYADAQMLWFDSEFIAEYDLAPRFILGYDNVVGARIRYWAYDHAGEESLPIIGSSTGWDRTTRLDFDVIDLEATTRVGDILLSGGARLAHIDYNRYQVNRSPNGSAIIVEPANQFQKSDLGGVTFAAEGRTLLISTASALYGGRLSVLRGDWNGDYSFTPGFDPSFNLQDETFLIPEIFTGLEARYGSAVASLRFEFQDWQGRPRGSSGGHNFGFTGFGFDLGWAY